jgi:sulfite reductase (ferredoxin)
LLDEIRAAWRAAGLTDDNVPTIRLTGCPNSCARPATGEIGIVGMSLNAYIISVGGNAGATRLNTVHREKVRGEDIAGVLGELFVAYAADRTPGEGFGDFCHRAQPALV